jgi:hypothetical protein
VTADLTARVHASAEKTIAQGTPNPGLPAANYDVQIGESFTQSFTSMTYAVTAVAQTDSDGYGPAYLLNGLSSSSYWYQVGLSYNWPGSNALGAVINYGFSLNYEVFDSAGNSIFPSSGGGGLASFSGPVNQGDSVSLYLYFSNGNVVMSALDHNTGSSASESYTAYGSSFGGTNGGFFTGLMTEWWHSSATYANEMAVTYSDNAFALSSASLWADEWVPSTGASLFYESSPVLSFSNPDQLIPFSSNGFTSYADAYEFITGAMAQTTINLVPVGQSSPLSASNSFTATYTSNGVQQTTADTGGSVSVLADPGTNVVFSAHSNGSSTKEEWVFDSQASGITVAAGSSATLYYYDLLNEATSYAATYGGSPPPPSVTFTSAPSTLPAQPATQQYSLTLSTSTQPVWALRGTSVSVNDSIAGGQGERWSASVYSWIVTQPNQVPTSIQYYHQFQVTFEYIVEGGGNGFGGPTISYSGKGNNATTNSGSAVWADASGYTFGDELPGSSSTERWEVGAAATGTISASTTITATYDHQFMLVVNGLNGSSPWYDAGTEASFTTNGVFGRSSGVGHRVTSYSIDGGAASAVKPTTGPISIPVLMSSTHTITFESVLQYQVHLDAGSASALESCNPTIQGDNCWYDTGTSGVVVTLNGVFGRSAGSGGRLVSWNLDSGPLNSVSTTGTITIPVGTITGPHSISTTTMAQYQLVTSTGSVSSISLPSLAGDNGWYDSGTIVKVSYNNVWNVTADGTRLNAIGYTVDAGAPDTISRSDSGTFVVTITMDGPHTIRVDSVTQFLLSISGGFDVTTSVSSPTNDSFFDSNTSVIVGTQYSWNITNGNTRSNLFSYTLNGQTAEITREGSGVFSTPNVNMVGPVELRFEAVTQCFVSFLLTDASGSTQIKPSSFAISVDGQAQPVAGNGMWLDNKSSIGVANVIWEGAEVKPNDQNLSTITGPSTITIRALVFPAKLSVSDPLGIPVGGAKFIITLANNTVISGITDSSGTVNLGLIPIGTFQASVSNLGFTSQAAGDASAGEVVPFRVSVSYVTLTVTFTAVVVALVFLMAAVVRGRRMRRIRSSQRQPGAPSLLGD